MFKRCFHISIEQGVAIPRGGFEFGVELHAHVPRVNRLRQLYDFCQLLALCQGGNDQTCLSQRVEVVDVGFITMAMTLRHHVAINLVGEGAFGDI